MPHNVVLSGQTDFGGWRDAARRLIQAGVGPQNVVWSLEHVPDLFGAGEPLPDAAGTFAVPRRFVDLAADVVLHSDRERFALLYRILWRLRDEPSLLDMAMDRDVARANDMAKNVRRDIHKMHAFVRFRAVPSPGGRERMVAWFEPEHHIIEAGAPFFARRFPNMLWSILSPEASAHWDGAELSFAAGTGRRAAPEDDALEEVWRTYYAAIFNPARIKVEAMRAEMPKKYWRNLPEAGLIGPLIADGRRRAEDMVAHAVKTPKINRQRRIETPPPLVPHANDPLDAVRAEARGCRACPLWKPATQTVFGEGVPDADILFVGEQPGDKEDLAGRPFVGPAGQMFDRALADADIDRARTYVTNAVKHFKFTPRGKFRLHQKPNTAEIRACKPWLEKELEIVRPKLVVALGATAVQSLFGRALPIGKNRGQLLKIGDMRAIITVHPSFLLRVPEEERKRTEYGLFVEDLKLARSLLTKAA